MHASTKWLILLIAIIALTSLLAIPIGAGHEIALPLPYAWHKWLHIFGAVLFLGNIIVTGFWVVLAHRSGKEDAVRFAAVAVNWADVVFTAPGVLLLLGNGILMSPPWGGLHRGGWLTAALGLFTLSGVVWGASLIPNQDRLARLAQTPGPLPSAFFATLRRWYFWGVVATVLPLVSLVLMVVKPSL